MLRETAQLPVSFDFIRDAQGIKGTFDSPTQRAMEIPLRNLNYQSPKIHFELVGDSSKTVFDGELTGDLITGQFQEGSAQGTFSLKRASIKPALYKSEEVRFQDGAVSLSGTLFVPSSPGSHAAVVFTHGSGPEGRFASRYYADYFARHNIAALIYDKRGVGSSTGDWRLASFEDLADDAIAAVHLLQKRNDIDPKKIGIYGHSQGGTIAPLIASRSKDVAFVIAAAGVGVPVYEQDLYRVRRIIQTAGFPEADTEKAMSFFRLWLDVARTGLGWSQLDAALPAARAEKWFEYVEPPPKDSWVWKWYQLTGNFNAITYWERVKVPVFLIYGELDQTVPVSPSITKIETALRKADNQDYTIIELPRAAHDLTISAQPGSPFEWRRDAPGYVELLTGWVSQKTK